MLKKIALVAITILLPLGAMAQSKFAHMNSQEVITVMPEFTKAQADLDALSKQKEIQDMAQRQEQFQKEAYQALQKAQQDAMTPIYKKLDDAIQAVGKAEGVVYIFDIARTNIPFIGAQSIDVTAKVKTQLGIK